MQISRFNNRARFQKQPAETGFRSRTFKVDPEDYKPTRLGIRIHKKVIVVEYFLRSSNKRFLHNIKMARYSDPMAFGISVSRSGSFK